MLWPTPPAVLPTQPSSRTVLLVDDFEQAFQRLNQTIWTPFMYGTAQLSGSDDNCDQPMYGRGALAIGRDSFRKLQPFTFPPNASISIYAVLAPCSYYIESPIHLEYSDDDEATWKAARSVVSLYGEWRRYSFSLPFTEDTYAHLRFRRGPGQSSSKILLDRLVGAEGW